MSGRAGSAGAARRPPRRRLAVGAALALCAVALVAAGAAVALTGGGSGSEPPAASRTDVPTIRRLLTERLRERNLTFRYVACVRSPARFEGGSVVRCNVNFNAPHIEVYCGVVRDGTLLTDHESAAVPCPRDDRGRDPPVQVWGG